MVQGLLDCCRSRNWSDLGKKSTEKTCYHLEDEAREKVLIEDGHPEK
jgi:hypothetical protein